MVPKHTAVRTKHAVLEQRDIEKIGIAHPGQTGLRGVLSESFGGDAIPDLAHAREAGRQRLRVGSQLFLGGRIVERAIDPDGAKQRIARVLLEPAGWLRPAIAAVVDVAEPAVIRPG